MVKPYDARITDLMQQLADNKEFELAMDKISGPNRNFFGCFNNYRKIALLGEGGMAEVWKAERYDWVLNQQDHKPVALKIVHLAMNTKPIIARFRREQKAMAALDHENIASLLDAGEADEGRPYYVMEWIDGHPITAHAERHHLPLRKRLELMLQVCSGVQHAHEKGIIHRDLKPSNILVEREDGKDLAKIIDFGVALAIGSERLQHTSAITEVDTLVGTLAYMSPEQTLMDAERVDIRSDVFGLGTVLYQLVTGHVPVDIDALAAEGLGRDHVIEIIRQKRPKKPSSVSADPLPKELDWVIMKALEKEPNRRYRSAGELSDDILRILKSEPVLARRPSKIYIMRKWIQRNRQLAAGILVAFAVGISIALAVAHDARVKADLAWSAALLERNTADIRHALEQHGALTERQVEFFEAAVETHALGTWQGFHAHLALHDQGNDPLTQSLWTTLEGAHHTESERFHAAAALAEHTAEDPRWSDLSSLIVDLLVSQRTVEPWLEYFCPIADQLSGDVHAAFQNERLPAFKRANAASLLAAFYSEDARALVELVSEATPEQFPPLVDALSEQPRSRELLIELLARDFRRAPTEAERDAWARQQSRAGMALCLLQEANRVLPFLAHSNAANDPRLGTFLIHDFARYHIPPSTVAAFLQAKEPWLVRAGLLALGDYEFTSQTRADLQPVIEKLFVEHPDSGVHGAAEWLLRHWHRTYVDTSEDAAPELPELSRVYKRDSEWFVTPSGMTMTVIHGPVAFAMGVPEDEPGRKLAESRREKELPHNRLIPRSFAIATKELTFEQFERFKPGFLARAQKPGLTHNSNIPHISAKKTIDGVRMPDVLRFCNWLSEQEGIPSHEWCFEMPDDPEAAVILKDNFLSLEGYRLATEAEWEYACRSMSGTARPYGFAESLLSKYAWYEDNSEGHGWAPGLLRPNAFGLFDMLGNRAEWVHGYYVPTPSGLHGVVIDNEAVVSLSPLPNARSPHYSTRGGFTGAKAAALTAGTRSYNNISAAGITIRLARTLP